MSIIQEISRIQTAKSDIADAIEAKGVDVPEGSLLGAYPNLISAIPSGGGVTDVQVDSSSVVDVDGVAHIALAGIDASIAAITALNPTKETDVPSLQADASLRAEVLANPSDYVLYNNNKYRTVPFFYITGTETTAVYTRGISIGSSTPTTTNVQCIFVKSDSVNTYASTWYTKSKADELLTAKQDTLTAGTGITISGNVISATGGGGGVTVVNYADIDASMISTMFLNPYGYVVNYDDWICYPKWVGPATITYDSVHISNRDQNGTMTVQSYEVTILSNGIKTHNLITHDVYSTSQIDASFQALPQYVWDASTSTLNIITQ